MNESGDPLMDIVNADIAKQHPGINKQYGKGSRPRTIQDKKYRDNYDFIFGDKKKKKASGV